MTDPTQTNTGTTQAVVTSNGGIIVDKNKSPEAYIKEVEARYIVPDMIREKFPDLVKLIYETESMNEEEREYWLQIMPIMSEDQTLKFREILVNEKNQLAKLDQEYEQEMSKINNNAGVTKEINEEEVKAKMEEMQKEETAYESSEQSEEADLLNALDSL